MSRYAVVLEQDEDGGFGAYSPDLPGCVAVGDTRDETLTLMQAAIEMHLAELRESGEPVPASATVDVAVIDAA